MKARDLPSTPDWLVGIGIRFAGLQDPKVVCRNCGEVLCVVEHSVSEVWLLADVARDHRKFCVDDEERERIAALRKVGQ